MGTIQAVFLDRDGTINEEVGYLDRLDKLKLIPGAVEAVRLINRAGMMAVVISNQSGVARGYFDESFVVGVHERIQALLKEQGARIDRFYYCPHHPTEGTGPYRVVCRCRKPEAGLFIRASQEMGIDLSRSYMVGDRPKDVEAAGRAGVKGILVRTGYGLTRLDPVKDDAVAAKGTSSSRRQPDTIGTHGEGLTASPEDRDLSLSSPESHTASVQPHHIADDILAAVTWILRDRQT